MAPRILQLVARRWTLEILDVLARGDARFSDISKANRGLTDRMLSRRLHELCHVGCIWRVAGRYGLTETGKRLARLLPILQRLDQVASGGAFTHASDEGGSRPRYGRAAAP